MGLPTLCRVTTRRHAEKTESILAAASKLFSERGFHGTRMSDVAAALDMQAGSLYYYFDSKDSVLAALIESRVGAAVEMLGAIAGRGGPTVELIGAAIAGHIRVFHDNADLYSIFLNERLEHIVPEAAEKVDELGRSYEQLWIAIIERGIASGELRNDQDPWLTMKATVGLCNSILFWFRAGGSLTSESVAAAYAKTILEGISA